MLHRAAHHSLGALDHAERLLQRIAVAPPRVLCRVVPGPHLQFCSFVSGISRTALRLPKRRSCATAEYSSPSPMHSIWALQIAHHCLPPVEELWHVGALAHHPLPRVAEDSTAKMLTHRMYPTIVPYTEGPRRRNSTMRRSAAA